MAYLYGEDLGRKYSVDKDTREADRQFKVIAETRAEDADDILLVCGVAYGDLHPRAPAIYAKKFSASQDSKVWWKWTVTVKYVKLESENEDPDNNPLENPLDRPPDISIDTESIMVAARGEVDATGATVKAILTSAGEPFDPVPEEEMEILLISITQWELPSFSMALYYSYQNAVNNAAFNFGDLSIAEGQAKLRIRVGKREYFVAPDDGTVIPFRQFDYVIAVSPLGWDLELLDWGSYYLVDGKQRRFMEDKDKREMGLLDGSGGKLPLASAEHFLNFKNKKRVNFAALNLPTGP